MTWQADNWIRFKVACRGFSKGLVGGGGFKNALTLTANHDGSGQAESVTGSVVQKIHKIRIYIYAQQLGNKPIITMTFLVDLSLVDLDPCKVEECIRESGWVIIDKIYVGFRNRPIFDDVYETYQHKLRDTQMLHKCWER